MTSLYLMALGVGILIALLELVARTVDRKLSKILAQIQAEGARLASKCMVREGAMECPGVAYVQGDQLLLCGLVENKRFEIPLSEISLTKEAMWWSNGKRWGRYAFHLETPTTRRLIVAVRDAEPWRRLFRTK